MKNILYSFCVLTFCSALFYGQQSQAQLVGTEAFLQGNFVEVGVATNGAYGSGTDAPAGYHPRGVGNFLGFVSDPAKDGWAVGTPNYIGDYFLPGSPQEGWDIQYNNVWAQAWRGGGATSFTGGLTGSCTGYSSSGTKVTATWEGSTGPLSIKQVTTLRTDKLYFVTKVTIKNTSAATVNRIYYERTVDPDNEVATPGGGSFTTINKLEFRLPNKKTKTLVSGTGETLGAYLGLGTKDCRAKPYIVKSSLTPSDSLSVMFNDTAKESTTAIFRFDEPDTAYITDVGIGVIFNIGELLPGDSTNLSYAYVLSTADLDSAFADVSPVWNYDGVQYESGDTVKLCRDKGSPDETKILNIDYGSGYTWTWSPRPGLKNLTGTENECILTDATVTYVARPSEAFGCIDSMVLTIQPFINPDPPTVTSPVTYCRFGSAVPLKAFGMPGAVFKYYTKATGGVGVASLTPSTNGAGTFTYYASQINGVCESPRTPITVIVNPIPTLDSFTKLDPTSCTTNNGWIQFKADKSNETYTVYYDKNGFAGPTVTLTSDSKGFIKIPGLGVGSYTAIYIVNKFGCVSNTYYGPIILRGPLSTTPPASNNGPLCEGDIAKLFTTVIDSTTYLWTGPGGFSSTNANPVFTSTSTSDGVYTLVITDTRTGCFSLPANTTLVVNAAPRNPKLQDQAICEGNELYAYVFPEANTLYTWTGGTDVFASNSSTLSRKKATLNMAGQYVLFASNDYGCKMFDTINVTIDPKVQLSLIADTSICYKDSILLWANTNTNTVLWSPSMGMNDSTLKSPKISPNSTTVYTVVAKSDYNTCPDSMGKVKVTVMPTPSVVGYDTLVRMNIPYTLLPQYGNNIIKWKWMPSDSLSCSNCPNPVFNSSKMMQYIVYGTDGSGCTGSDTVTVKVFCDGANVTMPNAFTPNGDGNNDIFYVRGQGFSVKSFSIYNRLGQQIFTKENFLPNDPQYGWDGTFGGQNISDPAGYVYMIEAICLNSTNEPLIIKGTVLMIK